MANYQELLSKAVGALPENNGASRREVYEKARKALVTQLRAINPPLPAREITQHRLELEDCIREVEHQATEELLGGLRETENVPIEPVVETPVAETSVVETPVVEAPVAEKIVEPVVETGPVINDAAKETSADKETAEKALAQAPVAEKSVSPDVKLEETKTKETKTEEAKPAEEQPTAPEQKSAEPQPAEKPDAKVVLEPKEAEENIAAAEPDSKSEKKRDEVKPTEAKPTNESKSSGNKVVMAEEKTQEPAKSSKDDAAALDAIIAQAEESKEINIPSASAPKVEPSVSPTVEAAPEIELENKPKTSPETPPAKMTTESDKGVGAAMSRVREVDNVSKAAVSTAKDNVSVGVGSVTSPLEGAGIVGVGNVGSALSGAKAATDSELGRSTDNVSKVAADAGGDAQSAVDRAIKALDREARGEKSEDDLSVAPSGFAADEVVSDTLVEEKSSNGLTIFLVLVILLLGAVGGGGYWAWKEGFIDLDSLFASGETVEEVPQVDTGDNNGGQPIRQVGTNEETSGPGNTTTEVESDAGSDANVALEDPNKTDERLDGASADAGQTDPAQSDAGNVAQPNEDDKAEDRLGADDATTDPTLVQEGDPDAVATNAVAQSLLLEASPDGGSGAVPFSGTVEWSRGLDELGEPTLIGQANIPARNLNVKVLIRRNGDVSLPASHLMEIDFDVSETFAGGAVAGLPGILLKNEELVQGAALVGASARVVGNSFLFALSAAEQDIRTNLDLLENRKWMDLALIYSSGRRAIITLEKDDAAQTLFSEVMAKWAEASGGNGASAVQEAAGGAGGAVTDAVDLVEGAVAPQ